MINFVEFVKFYNDIYNIFNNLNLYNLYFEMQKFYSYNSCMHKHHTQRFFKNANLQFIF